MPYVLPTIKMDFDITKRDRSKISHSLRSVNLKLNGVVVLRKITAVNLINIV